MKNTDSQFETLVQIVKNQGPDGYTVSEEIEEYHVLFESDSESTSFNVLLLSTDDKTWVEVGIFKGGKIIESETFETEDDFKSFVSDELGDWMGDL